MFTWMLAHTQVVGSVGLALYFWVKAMLFKFFKYEVSRETDLLVATIAAAAGVSTGM